MREWVGRKFVILPQPAEQQRYGYSCLRRSEGGYIIPDYEDVAGKIATVTDVEIPAHGDRRVHLTLDENGKEYVAVTKSESIPCLAPAADIDSARTRWLGKTLWVKRTKFLKTPDGKTASGNKAIHNYSAVTVEDVQAGFDFNVPVRYTVSADGQQFVAEVRASNLNVSDRPTGANFDDVFLTEDPRITNVWPARIWHIICNSEIETGMTPEQVQMSWGDPNAILEVDSEHCDCMEWEFGSTTLYFKHGKLDRAEDR